MCLALYVALKINKTMKLVSRILVNFMIDQI